MQISQVPFAILHQANKQTSRYGTEAPYFCVSRSVRSGRKTLRTRVNYSVAEIAWHGIAANNDALYLNPDTTKIQYDSWKALRTKKEATESECVWRSMAEIAKLSLPLSLTNLSGFSLNCLSDAMIGRLGAAALSTTTLANSLYSMMGISIIWGGAAGMETLAGQAYGAGEYRMMHVILLRAMVVCLGLCLCVAFAWQHAHWLLAKIGQCPTMALHGAEYLQAMVPSLFMYVVAECLQSYCVCQNKVQHATWAKAMTSVLGPGLYYLLMFKLHLGLTGAAYAYAGCKLANALILCGFLAWDHYKDKHAQDAVTAHVTQYPSIKYTQLHGLDNDVLGTNNILPFKRPDFEAPTESSDCSSVGEASTVSLSEAATTASGRSTSFLSFDDATAPQPYLRQANPATQHHQHELLSTASTMHHVTSTPVVTTAQPDPEPSQPQHASPFPASSSSPSSSAKAAAAAAAAAAGAMLTWQEVLDPRGCWEYIKYGLPSAAMTLLEWWAYEINVILAGTLPNAEVILAVLGICMAISGWVYMIPQSIGTAAGTRISNALGSGRGHKAKAYFKAALILTVCTQAVLSLGIAAAGHKVVSFFCEDAAVMAIAVTIIPILACNIIADGMNVVLNGVLRACGRQAQGAQLQLVSYWVLGVPLSWLLGVKLQLGIAGFMAAIGIMSCTQAVLNGVIISRFDWQHEVERCQQILSDMTSTLSSGLSATESADNL